MFGLEKVATKLVIGGILSASVIIGGWYMWNTIQRLEAEKEALKIENTLLQKVNEANIKTIKALEKNDEIKNKLVTDLKIQIGRDKSSINELRSQIERMKSEDDGPISKVLKDTINGIQTMRDKRKIDGEK
jgi:predicted negative regulator of RcsB-dependent stress response